MEKKTFKTQAKDPTVSREVTGQKNKTTLGANEF